MLTDGLNLTTSLLYIAGTQPNAISFDNLEVKSIDFQIGNSENILLADIDQDGLVDILLGRANGALEYWRNTAPQRPWPLHGKTMPLWGSPPAWPAPTSTPA